MVDPGGHVPIPTVKVFVGVFGEESKVFQDTIPWLASGNDSSSMLSMSSVCRTTGLTSRSDADALEFMMSDAVRWAVKNNGVGAVQKETGSNI